MELQKAMSKDISISVFCDLRYTVTLFDTSEPPGAENMPCPWVKSQLKAFNWQIFDRHENKSFLFFKLMSLILESRFSAATFTD